MGHTIDHANAHHLPLTGHSRLRERREHADRKVHGTTAQIGR